MMRNLTLAFLLFFSLSASSQILFSEDFSGVTLDDGAAMLPAGWITQNRDGQAAIEFDGNFPFNLPQYAYSAWAVTDHMLGGNAAVISTGLNGPVDNITDRWLISPKVENLSAVAHLFWKGFTDNANAIDKCEVWVTTSIVGATPTAEDFLNDNANLVMDFKMTPNEFNTYAARLVDYAGQDIYFAIRNLSFIPARVILDDFVIKDAVKDDLGVKGLNMRPYWISGESEVKANVLSLSPEPINSISMSYQVDGIGAVVTETFNVSLMEITDREEITFNKKANLENGGHDIKVWVESVNGNTDDITENNEKEGFISVMDEPPFKKVLIQEFTGAWCGWCPEGALFLESLASDDPTFVPVAIHSGDEMENIYGGEIAGIAAAGYPSASFDFYQFEGEDDIAVGRNKWFDKALERIYDIVPVAVEIESHTYNRDTRELEVTIKTDFIGATKEDLRLNVWVIEDGVTGPPDEVGNNGWNNANYFDTDPTSPFYGMGAYLEADEFEHNHVFNTSLTGTWGDDIAFPSEVNAGETITKTYNYTLPEAAGEEQFWKAEDIHLIAFVSRYDLNPRKRTVLNATKGLTFLSGIGKPLKELSSSAITPNPIEDVATLEVNMKEANDLSIRVFNQLGQEVLSPRLEHFAAGTTTVELSLGSLSNGIYFVSLYNGQGGIHTQRVIVSQ